MRTTVGGVVIIVEDAPGSGSGGVVGALHRGPAVCVAQVIHLTLVQKGIVLVPIAAGGGAHAAASAGAHVVVILLEVVGWVRREGGFALRGESGIGDGVGEGAGAAEVHHVAEGHPGGDGEEDAFCLLVSFEESLDLAVRGDFTYKMKTPIIVVASLSLHLEALP
jgi:hypothetical protein